MNRWRGPWPEHSRPIEVEGGVQARSKRGAIGEQWWSRRFIGVLESLGMSGRLARGRNYARRGQVLGFELTTGHVTAQVQGSRPKPYVVRIQVLPLTARQWQRVGQALGEQALFRAKLLAGEMPHEIEDVFAACGTPLFPRSAADLEMSCSCPDWEVTCKHLAAVCYVLAEAFDDDPFAMLAWRGRGREDLLGSLRLVPAPGDGPARLVIDVPGRPLAESLDGFWSPGLSPARLRSAPPGLATAPDLLLRSFEPPAIAIRGQDLADLLTPAYQHLAGDDEAAGRAGRLEERMTANAEQIAMWNGPGGERRARQPRLVDTQVRLHNERLRTAAAVRPGEQVLDVGCGTGESARDAARAAAAQGEGEAGGGGVLGVDLSAPMLAVAARLSAEEGLANIVFEQADAQVHGFPPGRFDVAISRFGVMFFDDPVAAFTNIGRALRPDGRLALLVWQAREHNEWARAFRQALSGHAEMPELTATGHAFTLADPAVVRQILGAAGFADIGVAGVHQPVFYGADVDTALDLAKSLPTSIEQLAEMDEAEQAEALDRLRAALTAHAGRQGVRFDARSWVVTARRR